MERVRVCVVDSRHDKGVLQVVHCHAGCFCNAEDLGAATVELGPVRNKLTWNPEKEIGPIRQEGGEGELRIS